MVGDSTTDIKVGEDGRPDGERASVVHLLTNSSVTMSSERNRCNIHSESTSAGRSSSGGNSQERSELHDVGEESLKRWGRGYEAAQAR